jgi:hypothetical protein
VPTEGNLCVLLIPYHTIYTGKLCQIIPFRDIPSMPYLFLLDTRLPQWAPRKHCENWEWYEIGISMVLMGYKPSICVSGNSIMFVVFVVYSL